MTVYAFGLTSSDITPELPHMTLGASSKPTTTQIGAWITAYAAEVLVQLESLGVTTNATASTFFAAAANEAALGAIKASIVAAVVQRTLLSNQEQDGTQALALRTQWQEFIDRLRSWPWQKLGEAMPAVVSSSFSSTVYVTPKWNSSSFT